MTTLFVLFLTSLAMAQQESFLPQVANGAFTGGSIRTTFLLFNPTESEVTVHLELWDNEGQSMVVDLPELGSRSQFDVVLPPSATRIVESSGQGALVAGAARLQSPVTIGASAIFSIFDSAGHYLTETGVGSASPLTQFSLPVDTTGSFNTGLALFNPSATEATVELRLYDPSGTQVGDPTSVRLKAKGHLSQFVSGELFPAITSHQGRLAASSDQAIAALTLRQNRAPLSYTTLPVVDGASQETSFRLPQVADGRFPGGRISTSFLLFNLSSAAASVQLDLTDDDGLPMEVTLVGQGRHSSFPLVLSPGGSLFLQTDSAGPLVTGAASVNSSVPIGVAGVFTIADSEGGFLTESGIGASPLLDRFQVGLEVRSKFNTGIALYNPRPQEARLNLSLLDETGKAVSSRPLTLAAGGHIARFVTELFEAPLPAKGSVVVQSTPAVAALTIRQNSAPLSFTTLPVAIRGEDLPSSDDLLAAALQRGEISDQQQLLYRVYAAFGDPRLPVVYRGSDGDTFESDVLEQVLEQIDSFPQETQETLWSYFVPPFYAGSWYDLAQRAGQAHTGAAPRQLEPPCAPSRNCPTSPDWIYIDQAKVRIWYRTGSATDQQKAVALAGRIDAIWDQVTGLMQREPMSDAGRRNNGGDGKLDIAFAPMGSNKAITVNYVPGCEDEPVYIIINSSLSSVAIADVPVSAAHELMHAIQWSYDVAAFCLKEYKWMQEASATWVMDYVEPGNNLEQSYARYYLSHPEQSLEEAPLSKRPYGAYLFFFQLARGYSPHWIRTLWEATTRESDSLEAIEAGLKEAGNTSLKQIWPEFVRRNWNAPPADQYSKWDPGLTSRVAPVVNEVVRLSGATEKEFPMPVDLPHLSAVYYRYTFPDANVRSVGFFNGLTFQFYQQTISAFDVGGEDAIDGGPAGPLAPVVQPLTDEQRKGADIQVLLKRKGHPWEQFDENDESAFFICRQAPDQELEEMVVIVSNTEHQEGEPNFEHLRPQSLPPTLIVSNTACTNWSGAVTVVAQSGDITEQITANVNWANDGMVEVFSNFDQPANPEQPMSAFAANYFYLTGGTLDWQISGTRGSCTVTGNQSFSLGEDWPPDQNLLATFPFVLQGPYKRGVWLQGIVAPGGDSPFEVTEQWSCPPDQGGSFSATNLLTLQAFIHPGNTSDVSVGPSGTTIHASDPENGVTLDLTAH